MPTNSTADSEKEKTAILREAIQAGLASGEGVPANIVFERLEAKYKAMLKADTVKKSS